MANQWKQTALLVIDMQRDFMEEGLAMSLKGGKSIIPNVIKAVEFARQRSVLIIWVVREHDSEGRDVERFRRHFYGSGKENPTVKGSKGAELVDGLEIKKRGLQVGENKVQCLF